MLAGQSDRRPPQRRMNRRPPGRARPTPFLEPLSYAFHCQGLGSGWAVPHQSVLLVGSDDRLTVSKAGRSIHAGLPKGHKTSGWAERLQPQLFFEYRRVGIGSGNDIVEGMGGNESPQGPERAPTSL